MTSVGADTTIEQNVWFITLAAGHQVVATGRDPQGVAAALGEDPNLLAVKLDVTSTAEAAQAVELALDRFDRNDVLISGAGTSYKG